MDLRLRTQIRDSSGMEFRRSGYIGMRAARAPELCAVAGSREPQPGLNKEHCERLSRLYRDYSGY